MKFHNTRQRESTNNRIIRAYAIRSRSQYRYFDNSPIRRLEIMINRRLHRPFNVLLSVHARILTRANGMKEETTEENEGSADRR